MTPRPQKHLIGSTGALPLLPFFSSLLALVRAQSQLYPNALEQRKHGCAVAFVRRTRSPAMRAFPKRGRSSGSAPCPLQHNVPSSDVSGLLHRTCTLFFAISRSVLKLLVSPSRRHRWGSLLLARAIRSRKGQWRSQEWSWRLGERATKEPKKKRFARSSLYSSNSPMNDDGFEGLKSEGGGGPGRVLRARQLLFVLDNRHLQKAIFIFDASNVVSIRGH